MKFGRSYKLSIQADPLSSEFIEITPPFTIEFNINRGVMAALNSMQIRIMDLGGQTRNKIFQDWFNPVSYKKIILEAGYNNLSTIFKGNVFQAYSYRQKTDIITYIDARDGGFDTANTKTSTTISKDTPIKDAIQGLMTAFPNLQVGSVGSFSGTFGRSAVLDGKTFDLIQKYTGGKSFIDLETIHALKDGEYINGGIPLINSDTGLIGTPVRSDAYLIVTSMFEPGIILGQIIQIESQVQNQYDGQYKVVGLNHSGTISDAIGGRCQTKINLLFGTSLVGGLRSV